jgi:hypothetical protein
VVASRFRKRSASSSFKWRRALRLRNREATAESHGDIRSLYSRVGVAPRTKRDRPVEFLTVMP